MPRCGLVGFCSSRHALIWFGVIDRSPLRPNTDRPRMLPSALFWKTTRSMSSRAIEPGCEGSWNSPQVRPFSKTSKNVAFCPAIKAGTGARRSSVYKDVQIFPWPPQVPKQTGICRRFARVTLWHWLVGTPPLYQTVFQFPDLRVSRIVPPQFRECASHPTVSRIASLLVGARKCPNMTRCNSHEFASGSVASSGHAMSHRTLSPAITCPGHTASNNSAPASFGSCVSSGKIGAGGDCAQVSPAKRINSAHTDTILQ